MLKVAITGSTGLVGSRIIELLSNNFTFLPLRHTDIDITNKNAVSEKLKSLDFDIFLHFAAYTNVDGAETNREEAYKINVDGTKNIAQVVASQNKKLIYISTDFVFDGTNPPYFEDSKPNPISYYGETKYLGEQALNGNAMIVRLSYPYRKEFEQKKDFVRTIKSLLEQQKEIAMVEDSLFVPTFIDDIAYSLSHLINNYFPEIYHIVGENSLSPFEAGKLIAKNWNLDEHLIKPVSYTEYFNGKAQRPKLSDIQSKKNTFQTMKTFEEGLKLLI